VIRGAASLAQRLGRVLEQIEQHLEEGVGIDQDRRQRRIEALLDRHAAREPSQRDAPRMIEQRIDVGRRQLERPRVGEILHPVDQRDDAVDLGGDQLGELAIFAAAAAEQLRGAADARERVLDLVREHRRRADRRARASGAIGTLRDAARLGAWWSVTIRQPGWSAIRVSTKSTRMRGTADRLDLDVERREAVAVAPVGIVRGRRSTAS
jgi:hypothetical protein